MLSVNLEINIFCILTVLTILLSRRRSQTTTLGQSIFNRILIWTILILLADAGMWWVDGATFAFSREANIIISSLYYILQLVPGYQWIRYCDYRIFHDDASLKKRSRFYGIPVVIGSVLVLVNLLNGCLFTVSEANIYSRGSLVYLFAVIAFLNVAAASVMCLINARRADVENKCDYKNMALFVVPPVLATALQLAVYGLNVIWASLVLSELFVFISGLSSQIFTDELTGINNRSRLNRFLAAQMKGATSGKRLYAIVADIDDFRRINDIYGHSEGDRALILAAGTLKACCAAKNCFLARIGGDEFAIVLSADCDEQVIEFSQTIRQCFSRLFVEEDIRYILTVSLGFDWIDPALSKNFESLLAGADRKMYADRAGKK